MSLFFIQKFLFSVLIFFKIESCEFEYDTSTIRKYNFDSYVHKDLTHERVSIFLDYEVHPVDIKLWIDQVAESKVKEEKKSREPWAQVKINGILVYLVSREVDIKKISMNDKSFKYLLSKKDKEYRR